VPRAPHWLGPTRRGPGARTQNAKTRSNQPPFFGAGGGARPAVRASRVSARCPLCGPFGLGNSIWAWQLLERQVMSYR
jgi:hypothetical protein